MMRLRSLALICLLFSATPGAQQQRPMQADGVVRLLSDLENALTANNIDDFRRLTAPGIAAVESSTFAATSFADGQDFAAVRERDRRPTGAGYLVMTEMLLGRGKVGRISTWQLLLQPRDGGDTFEIAGATPIASVDGLVQLDMDLTQQYDVRDLTFTAPGLTLRLASGAVFLGRVADGATALIFRGKGEMVFAPADPAEQVQIRAFSGKPALDTEIESAFLRLSPYEFESRIAASQLVPTTLHRGEVARARQMFEEFGRRSYTLNLGDLATDRWRSTDTRSFSSLTRSSTSGGTRRSGGRTITSNGSARDSPGISRPCTPRRTAARTSSAPSSVRCAPPRWTSPGTDRWIWAAAWARFWATDASSGDSSTTRRPWCCTCCSGSSARTRSPSASEGFTGPTAFRRPAPTTFGPPWRPRPAFRSAGFLPAGFSDSSCLRPGDWFAFPLTVTVQYANGQSETVQLAVTSATHELRIPTRGPARQVDTRDDLSLVTVRR